MKAFVITIDGHEKSQSAADRCIESGKRWGVSVEKFSAITPQDNLYELATEAGIPKNRFVSKYSETDYALAAFMSHWTLWNKCIDTKESILILEHDAIITGTIPKPPLFVGNLAAPSYGKFETPKFLGWGKMTSKPYLPGAHGYIVTPMGARMLVESAHIDACTTDVYIDVRRFPWLEEYYPWCVEAVDTFSSIQNENGSRAKHAFNQFYEYVGK